MTNKIKILVDEASVSEKQSRPIEGKEARPSLESFIRSTGGRLIELESGILSEAISETYSSIVSALSNLPSSSRQFKIQSISFTLSIDSTGSVSLVSTVSSAVKAQTGITFVLMSNPGNEHVSISKAS